MSKISAGLLMYRIAQGAPQVLLAHPGGPFWRNKDDGFWSIPKGEFSPPEDPLAAAIREFQEETGLVPSGPFHPLEQIEQKGGKVVQAWAFEGDCDPTRIVSNTFPLEWPPRSGRMQSFPEIDRAAFFDLADAAIKIKSAQIPLLERLGTLLA